MGSRVFFTDMRCPVGTSLLDKLDRLMLAAGIETINFDGRFTAIKMHFGEPGNLSFLRPNFARCVADRVRALGGKPFLTDCNTLYVGRRKEALEHLAAANENGFTPLTTGCQVIIADGLKGTDDLEVPVPGGKVLRTAFIGRAIMDADIIVSLTHFKGHEMTGFGGTIKNIGMGCGSRAGKMAMHCHGKPAVKRTTCRGCGTCLRYCAQDAITLTDRGPDEACEKAPKAKRAASIDHEKCVGCGRCIGVCNFSAIEAMDYSAGDDVNVRMAEYTAAVLAGRPSFHISIVNQVSPCCDCHGENDSAIVPDVGMFASFDPVALDHACIDAVNAAPAIRTSALGDLGQEAAEGACAGDHFGRIHPTTNWRVQLEHAQAIGLGSMDYELVPVKGKR